MREAAPWGGDLLKNLASYQLPLTSQLALFTCSFMSQLLACLSVLPDCEQLEVKGCINLSSIPQAKWCPIYVSSCSEKGSVELKWIHCFI